MAVDWGDEENPRLSRAALRRIFWYFAPYRRRGYLVVACIATQAVQDTNRTSSKFPSLVAQAASASVVSNAGAAYFLPNKKKEQPADMQAQSL